MMNTASPMVLEAPGVTDDDGQMLLGRQYLCLSIGGELYAVAIDMVREILEVGRMTTLPLTPPFVRGVMNLRGAVVPVIDLNARFGGTVSTIGRRSGIIIVEVGHDHKDGALVIGALVDGVSEVLEIAPDAIESVPVLGTTISPDFMSGMARAHGRMLGILNLDHALERDAMAELIAGHQPH